MFLAKVGMLRQFSMSSSMAAVSTKLSKNDEISAYMTKALKKLDEEEKKTRNECKRWRELHETYWGKERDFENFPRVVFSENMPKVRLGFVPDSFFQALYPKIGVTGPYIFLFGGFITLLQKEIFVVDHTSAEMIPFFGMMYFLHKKFGPKVSSYMEKFSDTQYKDCVQTRIDNFKNQATATIDMYKKQIENESGQKDLFQAQRELVDLQLELEYRKRIEALHSAVKQRLDYQVEAASTKRNFQQQYMSDWIINSVVKSITPTQQKEVMAQCISDLKNISRKYAATA